MIEETKNAVNLLTAALEADPAYYYAWQANIAMSMYDALTRAGIIHEDMHAACNDGAKSFLSLLCRP